MVHRRRPARGERLVDRPAATSIRGATTGYLSVTQAATTSLRGTGPGWGGIARVILWGVEGDPHPYAYALGNPLKHIDPLGLKLRVCCKLIPAFSAVNANHCYFQFDQGRPSTIGLHGTQSVPGYILAAIGMDVGTVERDADFDDKYDPANPPTCGPWKDCGADDCVMNAATTYPSSVPLLLPRSEQ